MQIEELINEAHLESLTIEYKGIIEEGKGKDGKSLESGWLKTLVAFANTAGGRLIIGVEDKSHKVVALDQKSADRIILMIHRLIREKIEPIIDYDVDSIPVKSSDGFRYVLSVDVKPNANLPVALHEKGMLGIYVRNYGRTDIASQEQIRDLVLMSDNTPYDRPFGEDIYRSEDYTKLGDIVSERGCDINEKTLISRGIISTEKKLSKGALLFADAYDGDRTRLVCTQWPGTTKGSSVINASEECSGNILDTIERAIEFVRNHSVNGYKKEDDRRIAYYSYPLRSVTEGIVNAVGHRNYYIQGSQIEVNIFTDRLEITSPGALLGVRELHHEKNIADIIPRRRNDVICAILELCRYMEEKGSGFDKIEADYSGYDEMHRPFVSSDSNSFTLTLPDLTFKGGVISERSGYPEVYAEVALSGKNDNRILSFCYGEERSAREIAEYVGVTPSTFFRKSVLARLVEAGLLIESKNGNVLRYRADPKLVRVKNI